MKSTYKKLPWVAIGVLLAVAFFSYSGCSKKPKVERGDVAEAAIASYVAPGDSDEYYVFYSGGHSGQVSPIESKTARTSATAASWEMPGGGS